MSRHRRRAVLLLSVLAATLGPAAGATGVLGAAGAAVDTEAGIADDAQILYEGPAAADRAVRAWKAMGIDSVRIHARWAFVVPHPLDRAMPKGFRPRDHTDLGYNWAALDRAVAALGAAGIRPVLAITGSGPVWASRRPALENPRYLPDPRMFGDFAHAVATRFAGRVTRYLIWNEPNQAGWLQPQFRCDARRVCTPVAPHVYRELFRAAAAQVRAVDPAAEVLIGTLAPRGQPPHAANAAMRPLRFIRALGCVKADYRRDRTGPCAGARAVRASAFSYHPHSVTLRPDQHDPQPDNAAIGDIRRLERALDRTTAAGVLRPSTGARFNLHFTEFGYQTDPPDPISGVSPARQAAWVQWATYLAWRDPRVKSITQYEWIDEPTKIAARTGARHAGWQSGLLFADRRPKPLARAFPNPFFVAVLPHLRARFWGQVRPGGVAAVTLQRAGASGWATVARTRTNAHGYWVLERPLRTDGRFRFLALVPAPAAGEPPRALTSSTQYVTPRP